jgi:hypothetical protein
MCYSIGTYIRPISINSAAVVHLILIDIREAHLTHHLAARTRAVTATLRRGRHGMMCICSASGCQTHEHGDKPGPGELPLQLDSHGLGIALSVEAAERERADPRREGPSQSCYVKARCLCQNRIPLLRRILCEKAKLLRALSNHRAKL